MALHRKAGRSMPVVDVEHDWVDTAEGLEEVIDQALEHEAYAIDTEFLRERTYFPKLALVQIGWPGRTVLIDPQAISIRPLARLLSSDCVAVFHAAEQDLEILEDVCGCMPKRMFDTQLAAGFVGFSTPSLVSLAEQILRVRLSKGDRLTDWTIRPLTAAQRAYAASDVTHLLELRDIIVGELKASGRLEWVEAEIELLRTRDRGLSDPRRAWWRLKDGRVLRGVDRMVAQELCAWRELKARAEDKPVRFVLPDLAILTIAQSRPTTLAALGAVRGMDGRYAKGGAGKELLEIVESGANLDVAELLVPESEDFDRRYRAALTLIGAWIAQLARDARIDTAMLATRHDLVAFLRQDEDARLRAGWRAELVGKNIERLVSGDAALAFEPSGNLILEHRSGESIAVDIAVPSADWTQPSEVGAVGPDLT
jgi:ribonuclease D